MFCPQCGNKIPDVAKFCPVCGSKTGVGDGGYNGGYTESSVGAGRVPDNPYPPKIDSRNTNKQPLKSISRIMCIISCLVIVLSTVLPFIKVKKGLSEIFDLGRMLGVGENVKTSYSIFSVGLEESYVMTIWVLLVVLCALTILFAVLNKSIAKIIFSIINILYTAFVWYLFLIVILGDSEVQMYCEGSTGGVLLVVGWTALLLSVILHFGARFAHN